MMKKPRYMTVRGFFHKQKSRLTEAKRDLDNKFNKNYLTASLRDLPALKAGTFIAGILIF